MEYAEDDNNKHSNGTDIFFYCLSIIRMLLTLKTPVTNIHVYVSSVDQDQTAENVQSDLDLCWPLFCDILA